MVKVYYPPPNRDIDPQYQIIPAGTILNRIFDSTSYGGTATGFRYNGPRGRFDHQSRVNGKPADDPNRGIIYAGYTLTCCLVEVFGDEDLITIGQHELATIILNQSLKLLDLRGQKAWDAGMNASIANNDRRRLTQAWGKYFYDHPKKYSNIDGIIFSSAKNSEDAFAFYERAASKIISAKISTKSMKNDALKKEIRLAAKKLHIPIKFN